jgi:hypothetical protein
VFLMIFVPVEDLEYLGNVAEREWQQYFPYHHENFLHVQSRVKMGIKCHFAIDTLKFDTCSLCNNQQ